MMKLLGVVVVALCLLLPAAVGQRFPANFHFGTSTSPYQYEGNNILSDVWVMDHIRDVTVPAYADIAGDANDFYHRYEEDLDMVRDLEFNSFRFGVEWARVEPSEGRFSMAALDYYRRLLEAVIARGMRPMLQLNHYTIPVWVIQKGGWASDETPALFANFSRKVIEHLGDLVDYVATLNEVAFPRNLPNFNDPEEPNYKEFRERAAEVFNITEPELASWHHCYSDNCTTVIVESHRLAQEAIKEVRPEIQVGFTLGMQDLQAYEGGEEQRDQMRAFTQDYFLEAAVEMGVDFVGIQTYTRMMFNETGIAAPPPDSEMTDMGYEWYPEGLCNTLAYSSEKLGAIPIYVTEGGVGTTNDTRRVEYYETALGCLESALESGVDVRGYYIWSAFDCYEWMLGNDLFFGLISVDLTTFERTVKGPSAAYLTGYARANGLALPARDSASVVKGATFFIVAVAVVASVF